MSTVKEPEVNWNQDMMVEVQLGEPDDFLKVRETLTRIGVASRKEKKLYQSCHILHKQGRYYIVHFKELFALMENTLTLLLTTFSVATVLLSCFLIGVS
tara:strand:- start:945 stop:1241 length:297 start_codon:yes stop_codon:yes gene_type:complete